MCNETLWSFPPQRKNTEGAEIVFNISFLQNSINDYHSGFFLNRVGKFHPTMQLYQKKL